MEEQSRPPLPPFDYDSAVAKVRKAEDAWNGKKPEVVALAYTPDSKWRNRSEFFNGREAIIKFLQNKWQTELDYRLVKEIWAFADNQIAVRFVYEWHDKDGQWYRSYGNENWKFADDGCMSERHASINDIAIDYDERKFLWDGEVRPTGFPELSELGL